MYGQGLMQMSDNGLNPVFTVNSIKFTDIQWHQLKHLHHRIEFDLVHIDIVGPLPPCQGYLLVLTGLLNGQRRSL